MGYVMSPDKTGKNKSAAVLVYNIHYENHEQFGYDILAGIQTAAVQNSFDILSRWKKTARCSAKWW